MTDEQFEGLRDDIQELSQILKKLSERDSFNRELIPVIQQPFLKLSDAVDKLKPVDLKPMYDIASDISKQNGSIMNIMGRLIHSQSNEQLITMVTDMVKRNNEFLSKIAYPDYTKILQSISEGITKRDRPERLVMKRREGILESVEIVYKKEM